VTFDEDTYDIKINEIPLSTGGFLGIGAHDVAIPTGQFRMTGDRLVLAGATKDLIRAMPPFAYARR